MERIKYMTNVKTYFDIVKFKIKIWLFYFTQLILVLSIYLSGCQF